MWAAAELEQQTILADFAVGSEAVGGSGEIDRAVVLVNLDGVAAAQCDVGAAFAAEMGEVAGATDRAIGIWRDRKSVV